MSMGAAVLGLAGGGPPRPPRPPPGSSAGACPCAGHADTTAASQTSNQLFGCLTGIGSPSKSVRLAMQSLERAPMISRSPRGVHRDRDLIADLERVPPDALLAELPGAPPLERPPLHDAVFVGGFDLQE